MFENVLRLLPNRYVSLSFMTLSAGVFMLYNRGYLTYPKDNSNDNSKKDE